MRKDLCLICFLIANSPLRTETKITLTGLNHKLLKQSNYLNNLTQNHFAISIPQNYTHYKNETQISVLWTSFQDSSFFHTVRYFIKIERKWLFLQCSHSESGLTCDGLFIACMSVCAVCYIYIFLFLPWADTLTFIQLRQQRQLQISSTMSREYKMCSGVLRHVCVCMFLLKNERPRQLLLFLDFYYSLPLFLAYILSLKPNPTPQHNPYRKQFFTNYITLHTF